MSSEVVEIFRETAMKLFVDCTVGLGGHSRRILKEITAAEILALDVDAASLALARENLAEFSRRIRFQQADFTSLFTVGATDWRKVGGMLIDPGISMYQLKDPRRGFSHTIECPLDMRKTAEGEVTAATVVNTFSQDQLQEIFANYGEVARSREIAKRIVERRLRSPLRTTIELRQLVEGVCHWQPRRGQLHPAAKVFQALRIFVNRELEGIEEFLRSIPLHLRRGARVVYISYHSLEDRIVKKAFRWLQENGSVRLLKPFPRFPTTEEVRINPPSRSAKLRACELL